MADIHNDSSEPKFADIYHSMSDLELQKRPVLLHPVDEHEAPCVLELALHRDAVELATDVGPGVGAEPRGADVLVEPRLDERAVEGLIAVFRRATRS